MKSSKTVGKDRGLGDFFFLLAFLFFRFVPPLRRIIAQVGGGPFRVCRCWFETSH